MITTRIHNTESEKSMKTIQEQNREFIIMANNPTAKTYEEALEMELGFGCEVICTNQEYRKDWVQRVVTVYDNDTIRTDWDCLKPMEGFVKEDIKIIGKPLTLNRVLIAFNFIVISDLFFSSVYLDSYKNVICLRRDRYEDYEDYIDWDLTKETLEEQSEEVQIAINKMIK
jgi:hypothetical protein